MIKRYDYENGELVDDLEGSKVKSSQKDPSKDLYDRVGERFRVDWVSGAKAEPIVYLDSLNEASENDVLKALNAMKSDGVL